VSVFDCEPFQDTSEGLLGGGISFLALCDESGDVTEWLYLGVGFCREVERGIGELEAL
jgi:hypothetical protein